MKKLLILLTVGSVTTGFARQYDTISGRASRWDRSYDRFDRSDRYDRYNRYDRFDNYDNYDSQFGYGDEFVNDGQGFDGGSCCDQNYMQPSEGYYQRGRFNDYGDQRGHNQMYNRDSRGQYGQDRDNMNRGSATDQEINKNIQSTIGSGWFSKGYENVQFQVMNGNVTLRGTVDSLEDKTKIEDSVRKITGVKQINNQINVKQANQNPNQKQEDYSDNDLRDSERKFPQDFAASPQDRILNAKIRDKLGSGWFSKGYDTLIIRTTNGVVIISGRVDNPDDIQKISDTIRETEGVRAVNSQLNIKNR